MGRTPDSQPQSSRKIAVALLSDTVGLDAGTERQVVETAKRLDKNRFDVHVVCLEDSPQLRSLPRSLPYRRLSHEQRELQPRAATGDGLPQICGCPWHPDRSRLHE